jgi:hypothetical protein
VRIISEDEPKSLVYKRISAVAFLIVRTAKAGILSLLLGLFSFVHPKRLKFDGIFFGDF